MPVLNRWWIAVAGVCCRWRWARPMPGASFAFLSPSEFGWSITQVTSTFLISWFFLGCSRSAWRFVDEARSPRVVAMTAGLLWGGGVFLASFSAQRIVVALSDLRRDRRDWAGDGLHRSDHGPGEVVSRPARAHYGNCGGRVRSRIAVFRARRRLADPACGTDADVRVSRRCVRDHRHLPRAAFMQNPPEGWSARRAGLQPQSILRSAADRDYTLGEALGTWQWWAICLLDVDQHDVGTVDRYPGVAHFSGDGKSQRGDGSLSGRDHGARQRRRDAFFGPSISDLDDAENGVFPDVPGRSDSFLELPHHPLAPASSAWPLSSW